MGREFHQVAYSRKDVDAQKWEKTNFIFRRIFELIGNLQSGSGDNYNITQIMENLDEKQGVQQDTNFASLLVRINAKTLVPGSSYQITDFNTTHYITDDWWNRYDTIITGSNEPLIVNALSVDTLSPVARSVTHPDDLILYDWNSVNWMDDLSFADAESAPATSIIPGFKGVIYFRYDTKLGISAGYDWRNCKSRRWIPDISTWSVATPYVKKDIVRYNNVLYFCTTANTGQTPSTTSGFYWAPFCDLNKSEYILPDQTLYVNDELTINATDPDEYRDYLTFEGLGTTTVDLCVKDTHFAPYKTTYSDGPSPTIVGNNVIFLHQESYLTTYNNKFRGITAYNTFTSGNSVADNSSDADIISNIIGSGLFANAFVGGGVYYNIIGDECQHSRLGYTTGNIIGYRYRRNYCPDTLLNSWFGREVAQNTYFQIFQTCFIGNVSRSNIFGSYCNNIDAGHNLDGNIFDESFGPSSGTTYLGDVFQNNHVKSTFTTAFDFTALPSTHVYASYHCEIYKRVDGTWMLDYVNNDGVRITVLLSTEVTQIPISRGSIINSLDAKTTPIDADYLDLMDSADSNKAKKISWANIKATLKTYFDAIYQGIFWSRNAISGYVYTSTDTDKVGIGTSTPAFPLHIKEGDAQLIFGRAFPSTSYAGFGVVPYGGTPALGNSSSFYSDGSNSFFNSPSGGNTYFRISNNTKMVIDAGGNIGIGYFTAAPGISDGQYSIHLQGKILRLETSKTPASATATGYKGEICWDSDYIYVCVDTNTWKRVPISTWP